VRHSREPPYSITPMCAPAPRTEAQFVGVRPWWCGDWASLNNGERVERGREYRKPTPSHSKNWVTESFKESESVGPVDESIEMQIVDIYLFCQPTELLHDTIPTPPSKSGRVESGGERLTLVLCLQERQEWVCVSHSGSDLAGIMGGGEGVETGSDARSAGMAGIWGRVGVKNPPTEPIAT